MRWRRRKILKASLFLTIAESKKGTIDEKNVLFGLFLSPSLVVFTNKNNGNGLQSIVMVERTRHLWNKVTHEVHFYLSSLPIDAHVLGNAIRTHWGIENQVHWTLDVTFNEDKSRIRSCHAPRNFALFRRMALNALNLEKTLPRSLRQKSKRAAMNNDYMMTVLKCFCQ